MSKAQEKKRQQVKLARLEIVSGLFKKGYSRRKIREEVMKRLNIETYSLQTVQKDIQTLLDEWREARLEDTDELVTLELARIDDTCRELWEQWEKSKENYTKQTRKQKGSPSRDAETGQTSIKTYQTERTDTEVIMLGDPSYIAEIRKQLEERRKLLGLYAPEKTEVSGGLSFASLLVESGMLEEAETQNGDK
ncbi:MAG: hypothetical protein IJN06_01435 [Bacteroidales bacterium]|nr:hypothetical protein [Bacteroidales bacterium]